ncbi:hypothetical protein RhiirA1_487325 [Rhizophagus irregularis]|uniref:Uncharacterized protein n=1 Tax=Rhizophagus irregularis TaxID=588596 RepID=A0A2N0QGF3_9GLOM|nr:hypothetical protein RhiirA1_487325 [Rhizophagus irregularis]
MEKMLRNGMVVDPQERETIEYALSEQRWGGDPWGLGVNERIADNPDGSVG